MLNLEVTREGPYMRFSVKDFYGIKIMSDILDDKEAVDVACQLISAAEELLPATCIQEEAELNTIREELEK